MTHTQERGPDVWPVLGWLGAAAGFFSAARLGPVPLAEGFLALLAAGVVLHALRFRRPLPGAPLILLVLCLWLGSSVGLAAGGIRGAARAAHVAGTLWVAALAFGYLGQAGRRRLLAGVAGGLFACLALAVWQYAAGRDAQSVGGLLGSRAVLGLVLAAGMPVLLSGVAAFRVRRVSMLIVILAAAAGGLAILYLPALALFIVGVLAWGLICGRGRIRIVVTVAAVATALLVLAGATPRPNRSYLRQSIASADDHGLTRRWAVEARAAVRAIVERPALGSGAGSYQQVVSSGRFRQFLPATAEPTVERGTQCGYLVLAVEAGIPAAILWLLVMLAAAAAAWRRAATTANVQKQSTDRSVALALVLSGVATAFTPLTVQGALVFVAAIVAVGHGQIIAAGRWRWAQRAWLQAAALLLFSTIAFAIGRKGTIPPSLQTTGVSVSAGDAVLLEAEGATNLPAFWERVDDSLASGGKALRVVEANNQNFLTAEGIEYAFDVTRSAAWRLWLRARWQDGCGNSFGISIDGSPPALLGNDGTYGVWQWVAGPAFPLQPGRHTLRLMPRERQARADQVLFTADPEFCPMGFVTAGRSGIRSEAAPAAPAKLKGPEPWISAGRDPRPPFMAAVGGAYQGGPESFFVGMGIPYERLQDAELTDTNALARYGVVWISGPQVEGRALCRALEQYVTDGGMAIVESMEGPAAPRRDGPAARLFPFRGRAARRGVTVHAKGSPMFDGITDGETVHEDVACTMLRDLSGAGGTEVYGELRHLGQPAGPVFAKIRQGRGVVYALALPIGFDSMWRETVFDPLGRRIVQDAIVGRYDPLYARLKWNPAPAGVVHFSDDFMRQRGENGAWTMERGEFALTGSDPSDAAKAFCMQGTGPASAAAGQASWRAYRLSASVLAKGAAAGLWMTTTKGRRLAMVLDGARASLVDVTDSGARHSLAEGAVPAPLEGWRCLSLFRRDSEWVGYLDGEQALSAPAGDEEAGGPFGLLVERGQAWFDDVRVCDAASLEGGRDRALGEEGSPRVASPMAAGLEPRTVYSPQWFLRPDDCGRHAFRVLMPFYGSALLRVDDKSLGTVGASGDGALVYLPEGQSPEREISLICPLWRDYGFGGQVADWYCMGAPWQRQSRWSCDPKWEWLGVQARESSVLWYRQPLAPPYAVYVLAAPSAPITYGSEAGRDLNLVLGGNGRDLSDGYIVRVGPTSSRGCELWKGKERLAQEPKLGLPRGHSLHHTWFALLAVVEEKRIRFFFDDRPAFDCPLAESVPAGRPGFWTERNNVQVARITLSLSRPRPRSQP